MGIINNIFGGSPKNPAEINQNAIKDSIKSINSRTKENDDLENRIKEWKLRIVNAEAKIKENKQEIVEHENAKVGYEQKNRKENTVKGSVKK